MDFEPILPGFESRYTHYFLCFFCHFYNSTNSTLLSLLGFSYFITPYDAQASSAFSDLILIVALSGRLPVNAAKSYNKDTKVRRSCNTNISKFYGIRHITALVVYGVSGFEVMKRIHTQLS